MQGKREATSMPWTIGPRNPATSDATSGSKWRGFVSPLTFEYANTSASENRLDSLNTLPVSRIFPAAAAASTVGDEDEEKEAPRGRRRRGRTRGTIILPPQPPPPTDGRRRSKQRREDSPLLFERRPPEEQASRPRRRRYPVDLGDEAGRGFSVQITSNPI